MFFGKHVNGQPDDFPDIQLPSNIENTNIKLISPEQGIKVQTKSKSSFYINLIGWVESEIADFAFVTFSNRFSHQFDCIIKYKYDPEKKQFVIETTRFEKYFHKSKQ